MSSAPKLEEKKPRKRREPLTRDRIAHTALELIEQNGLEQLSTRRIGRALGCEAMAIYNHFPSKDALLDAVVDLVMRKVDVPAAGGGWEARVLGFARSYRALARIHPHAFPLVAMRRFDTPGTLALLDKMFAALLEEGFEAHLAVRLFRTVGNFCSGTALDEIAGASFAARKGATTQTVESDEVTYPHLARVATFLAPSHFDEIFETGLEVLLDGFRRMPGVPRPA